VAYQDEKRSLVEAPLLSKFIELRDHDQDSVQILRKKKNPLMNLIFHLCSPSLNVPLKKKLLFPVLLREKEI